MEKDSQRLLVSVAVVAVLSYLFLQSNPQWDSPSVATIYYSVLALLCVTMAVSIANRIKLTASPSYSILMAGVGYAAIIFTGAAIFYKLAGNEPVIHIQPAGIFLNLVAFATTGITMAIFSHLETSPPNEESLWYKPHVAPLIVAVGTLVFLIMMIASRLIQNQIVFLVGGYLCGGIAIVCYVFAGVGILRQKGMVMSTDQKRLVLAFFLLAVAHISS